MRKRVLVIGASGQLGRLVLTAMERFSERYEVTALTRQVKLAHESGFLYFNPDASSWDFGGHYDILVNCAGIIHESRNSDFAKVHVELVRKIIENRHLIGQPRIIHISALGADDEHPIAFLKTKGEADHILLKQPDTFILRPSIVCIPDALLVQKFKLLFDISRLFLNHALLPREFLETRIQPVMPVDFQDTILALCGQDPKLRIYNLVGKEELSFRWLIDLAADARKQKLTAIEIPKNLLTLVTRNFISIWFPGLINFDQYQLLFKDHIADKLPVEEFLNREVASTTEFWVREFAKS
jgi:uncharacterized protein YbjT (DUF2867 family)